MSGTAVYHGRKFPRYPTPRLGPYLHLQMYVPVVIRASALYMLPSHRRDIHIEALHGHYIQALLIASLQTYR